MITAETFMCEASRVGFDFYTGVPCSYLTPLINGVLSNPRLTYVGAASEGEAVAIAAGAWLAGRQTVVMCQNSGLGNAVNPLTSLNAPFCIPTLFVTTWRGRPGEPDEPQHEVMGKITQSLLSLLGLQHRPFPNEDALVPPRLNEAVRVMAMTGEPFAFVMAKGDVADSSLSPPADVPRSPGYRHDFTAGGARPSRAQALERFLSLTDDATAVIATTGKCGRELFTLADRNQHLYLVGSMGGAAGMALGVALNTQKRVVVLDGDGAALMKLGTFATIGARACDNLIHILLDNGVHDSTGGQPTVSASVDFALVALACGYGYTATCDDLAGFTRAWHGATAAKRPAFIHLRVTPGSMNKLGRPSIQPKAVAQRFKAFLAS
ncbi:MAG: phosphonopyruvate decarboxylase [Janthinobacterium lividum]